jgi:hypothetical protein
MTKRSIGMMIVLFLFTFGIYPIYWIIKFQVELKKETNEGFNGLGHFLMLIFTFGIYAVYWQYAAGKRLAKQGATDQSIIYLLFSLIAIGFVNPFLMQDQANRLVK